MRTARGDGWVCVKCGDLLNECTDAERKRVRDALPSPEQIQARCDSIIAGLRPALLKQHETGPNHDVVVGGTKLAQEGLKIGYD